MILDIEKYKVKYSFVKPDTKEGDIYYCDCGEVFAKTSMDVDLKKQLEDTKEHIINLENDEETMTEFKNLYKGVKLGFEDNVRCPKCSKNFQNDSSTNLLIMDKIPFLSGYVFQETEDSVCLIYSVIHPELGSMKEAFFSENVKIIRFEKSSKKLFFKDFNAEEREFDLDEIISIVDEFFTAKTVKIINLFDMHLFVGRLANFIMDAKNINVITELLEDLRSKIGDAGLEVIKKITSIFMGIIKYSNLSTIAMTKGSVFLYDLMVECKIPKSQILMENNVTSPIKIFNFLIKNYIKQLNEEVNSDNKDLHEFTFKSKQRINYDEQGENVEVEELTDERILNITINTNKIDATEEGKVKRVRGQYQVESAIDDGTISKFIFNKINNFSEYKRIIKFFKLVNKQELILLLQKYELEFLINVIDLIYFRNKVSFKEFERILDIMLDFTAMKSKESCMFLDGAVHMNYEHTKRFNFITFDDSLMMMEVLQFDPKVHFNKIRTWNALSEYHDNLIKYFAVLKEQEKNGTIEEFVNKFNNLESREDYDGPLEIKLLSTPKMIINEGIEMKHSASAYARNVAQGQYLMGQVYDKDPERTVNEPPRYTIGFTYNKWAGLEFDQVKGFANELGKGIPKKTDRFKKLMMEWLTIKDISFRPIDDLKLIGDDIEKDAKL